MMAVAVSIYPEENLFLLRERLPHEETLVSCGHRAAVLAGAPLPADHWILFHAVLSVVRPRL